MTTTIHRRSLKPHSAYCGATATPDTTLYLSDTGHPDVVNCPDCIGPHGKVPDAEHMEYEEELGRLQKINAELVDALEALVALIAAEYPAQQAVWLEEARAAVAQAKGATS